VVIRDIDGAKGEVDFGTNILQPGDTLNHASEKDFRRIQIRECIKSHLEKEKNLFGKGIKVLSLFFIDSVEKYRAYNPTGEEVLGEYAQIFEEEYRNLRNNSLSLFTAEYNEYMVQTDPTAVHKAYFPKESYQGYLERDDAEKVHSGYFSIDKKGRAVDPKLKRNLEDSDDVSAYDLIMKDKERLLSFEEPVRFIFSHSALKEGWDNPNVFQICALKNVEGGSQARRRQEVGRGMRLCVNKEGIRQDFQLVGEQVHEINKLTVVASESYEQFAKGLQSEIAETLKDRPQKADKKYFVGKVLTDKNNQEIRIDDELAQDLFLELFSKKVVDKKGEITPEGRGMIEKGEIPLPENLKPYQASICGLLKQIYTGEGMMPSNERNQVVLVPNQNFDRKDFQELWNKINLKTIYEVRFNSEELIKEGVRFINGQLKIADRTYELRSGSLKQGTIEEMREGTLMADSERETIKFRTNLQTEAVYDLIGELESRTQLTRHSLAQILKNIKEEKFLLFRKNPEEFISKCSRLINEAKSSLIVKEIIYHKTEERFDAKDVFTNDKSMLRTGNVLNKHIYDFLTTDSKVEAEFAHALEASKEVVVYAKLPRGFYITTPVAKYSPDWAIVFDQNEVKEIYFVVETKGSEKEEDLRGIEHFKIECAKKHFEVIDNINLKFVKKASYESLKEELSFVGEG
jgi:type III restriction enzyme